MKINISKSVIYALLLLISLSALYFNINTIVDFFCTQVLNIKTESKLYSTINFFFYDTTKILLLLFLISTLMGIINNYLPVEKLRTFLTTKKLYGFQYVFASLFGAVTPFCSCSSIPLFIGFVKGGIPLGVTFAYLITSPLVNEVAVAMFLGFFGLKTTLIYAGSGILMGVTGGYILGKFKLERFLSNWVLNLKSNTQNDDFSTEDDARSFIDRLPEIINDSWEIVRKVLLYVIIGIGIGAVMHGYVPENFFTEYLQADKWYTVPLAVLAGVPLYASASGIVPLIQVFVAKGVPLGTALAFMMAVVGLSLPEATLLKKVMKWRLIGIFFGTISLMIICLGYIFNIIL